MGRPRKTTPVGKLTVNISADVKRSLDDFVRERPASQVAVVESALRTYIADELGTSPSLRVPISEEMQARLTAYAANEARHDPRQENIARDALNILLRTRDESQSEEFVVKLLNLSLVDRFAVYRQAREWDRSRVAEKALDRYLLEQERRDPQYRAALRPTKRGGRA